MRQMAALQMAEEKAMANQPTIAPDPTTHAAQVVQSPAAVPVAPVPATAQSPLPPAPTIAADGANHTVQVKAVWSTSFINDLPNSSFLYIEPGAQNDGEGKTTPRSKRHFPYKNADGSIDLPHLRNAIARIPQSNAPGLTAAKKTQLQERARRLLEQANKDVIEKMGDYGDGKPTMEYYPLYGATSFSELEALQKVQEATSQTWILTENFQAMVNNIMADHEPIKKGRTRNGHAP